MEQAAAAAVTIYADASVAHLVGTGSWGAVIVGGGPDIELGGAFRIPITCSSTGEAQALANALHAGIAAGRVRRGTEVLLVCDNQAVILTMQGAVGDKSLRRARRKAPALMAAFDHLRLIIRDCGAVCTFHWVRGHQLPGSPDPHADGNRRADKLARHHNPNRTARKASRAARRKAKREREAAAQQVEA